MELFDEESAYRPYAADEKRRRSKCFTINTARRMLAGLDQRLAKRGPHPLLSEPVPDSAGYYIR
ncbi:MAG: hypothetical protein KTR25_01755 [Myxococcales bacterium]|nr:hypothetical protein [Myxococcales bacterium]